MIIESFNHRVYVTKQKIDRKSSRVADLKRFFSAGENRKPPYPLGGQNLYAKIGVDRSPNLKTPLSKFKGGVMTNKAQSYEYLSDKLHD